MLELSHVCVNYGGRKVLRDVSISFKPGELLILTGPNGGGKSTLIRAAAGLLPVSDGAVLWNGVNIRELPPRELAKRVAYLPQSRRTPDITVFRMALHGRYPHLGFPRRSGPEDRAVTRRALEEADAAELAEFFFD